MSDPENNVVNLTGLELTEVEAPSSIAISFIKEELKRVF